MEEAARGEPGGMVAESYVSGTLCPATLEFYPGFGSGDSRAESEKIGEGREAALREQVCPHLKILSKNPESEFRKPVNRNPKP